MLHPSSIKDLTTAGLVNRKLTAKEGVNAKPQTNDHIFSAEILKCSLHLSRALNYVRNSRRTATLIKDPQQHGKTIKSNYSLNHKKGTKQVENTTLYFTQNTAKPKMIITVWVCHLMAGQVECSSIRKIGYAPETRQFTVIVQPNRFLFGNRYHNHRQRFAPRSLRLAVIV